MRRLVLVTLLSASVIGCTTEGIVDGPVGTAEARITQVPSNVGCISITASAGRSVTDNFDVTAGQSAVLHLGNLPVGNVTFTAVAYALGCAQSAGAQPTWGSNALTVPIVAGQVTNLALTLSPTGGAVIGIDFSSDGGTLGDGGVPVDFGSDGGAPSDGGTPDFAFPPPDLSTRPADLAGAPVDLAFRG